MPQPKFRSVRVDAVVIRHSDYGEADRLLTLYTRQRGKMRVIAKGARKIASRKAGHIEPFTHVKLQLAAGRDMFLLTQADTVDAYLPLRDDLMLTGHAAYVLELLDRFTYEDETENSTIFRLVTETLTRLASRADVWLVLRFYEMRLLDQLGFRPQLFECVNCGREIKPEDQFFSFNAGGVICPRCGQGLKHLHSISVEALKYLRHFQRSSYAEASRARPDNDVERETESLMQGYFTYLLERELNTPGFLKKIKS
ncbi:MAG: DNA repair protein RecO [Anaerolineales bacterium]|nr:DNA repair protein RecO [Anaerolineales bacterium]